jgi:peptidoglycan-N-acetylglucosamine deacetylase
MRVDRSRGTSALVGAGAGAAAAAVWTAPALAPVAVPVARALRIPRRVAGETVALTFDDGPHPQGTPATLDLLAAAGVPATFFLVGEQVERRPELARRIVAEGHAVAVHGFRHRNQLRLTPAAVVRDAQRGAAAIERATGVRPALMRPAYGIFSAGSVGALRRAGFEPLLWSRWGRDWRVRTGPRRIAALTAGTLVAGDVLLLHDSDAYSEPGSWRGTVAALPEVLAAIGASGLAPAAVLSSRARPAQAQRAAP